MPATTENVPPANLPRVRTRKFGRFNLDVSEIGFGTWGIGGRTAGETSYGETNDDQSNRALDTAVGCGINFFDTAAAYGDGHSEVLLGALAKRAASPLIVSTKAGIPRFGEPSDFSPAALKDSLAGSQQRLGRAPGGLLLHNPTSAHLTANTEIIAFLESHVSSGALAFWGLSVKSPADGMAILDHHDVPVIQVNLNMLDVRAVTSGLLDKAQARGTAVIARTPLCFGFLSGAVDETTTFPAGDHRNAWSKAQKRAWADGAHRATSLAAPQPGETMAQSALRFCLSFPAVAVVLPGPLTDREVIENAGASPRGPLSKASVEQILELNRQVDFFVRG